MTGEVSGTDRDDDEVFAYDPSPIRYPVPPLLAPLDLDPGEPDDKDEPDDEPVQETTFDPLMYEPGIEAVIAPEEPEPFEVSDEAELVSTEALRAEIERHEPPPPPPTFTRETAPPVPGPVGEADPSPVVGRVRAAIGLLVVVIVAGIAVAAVVGATVAALAFAARRLAGG